MIIVQQINKMYFKIVQYFRDNFILSKFSREKCDRVNWIWILYSTIYLYHIICATQSKVIVNICGVKMFIRG